MPFTQTVMPQYRDADHDGLIGLKGCMRYFQDVHTWYMHSMNKGNDVLPEQYGAAWIYTRYQISLARKLDYTEPIQLCAWIAPSRSPVRVPIFVTIRQHDQLAAQGQMESCLFSLTRQRPLRPQAVELPENLAEELPNTIPAFSPLEASAEGMEERYTRTVRVTDLDKSRHMTNLRYIEMFQDAYDSAFWEAFAPKQMELRFLSQCREGETLTVKSRPEEGKLTLAALHADGSLASVASFGR